MPTATNALNYLLYTHELQVDSLAISLEFQIHRIISLLTMSSSYIRGISDPRGPKSTPNLVLLKNSISVNDTPLYLTPTSHP